MKEVKEIPELTQPVKIENQLKDFIVDYVGDKLNPEDKEVTIQMVIEVLADDFPEIVLALAEENFIRGYNQAFIDLEEVEKGVENNNENDEQESD